MSWYAQHTIRGYSAPEVVSALQKSIRRSDQERAAYWAVELDRSGFGAHAWNRLLIIVSEDIGLSDPHMPATIRALYETWKEAKARRSAHHPERLMLVHAALLLARAKKSRMVDHATCGHYGINDRLYEIPDEALDMHTARGRGMGRGLEHWYAEAAVITNEADLGPDPFFELNCAADNVTERPLERAPRTGRGAPSPDEPEQEEIVILS